MTNWRERITAHPDVLVGKAVILGTRISVELIMDLLARGYTRDQIIVQYPHLVADDVQACLAYAAGDRQPARDRGTREQG